MSSKPRLLFYTSVLALATGMTYGIGLVSQANTEQTEAFAPAMRVASANPARAINASAVPREPRHNSDFTLAAALAPPRPNEDRAEAPRSFEGGDKIKLLVYERLPDAELSKYGKNGFSEQDFQQRQEMSNEFTVSADETVSIPMLGTFAVTGSTPQQLEGAIAAAYEQKMKRPGFVTIVSITRPPILILGPVKTQGKVDYSPNMTVLHALAMAGGIKNGLGDDEPWQKMESIRERINHASAVQDMADLYAQRAVLESERDHIQTPVPEALITLVGPTKASALIATETDRRRSIVQARQQQLEGYEQQLAAYKAQLSTLQSTNMAVYDQAVALAEKRAMAMTQFSAAGTINNVQLQAAQTELLNAKGRRDEVQQRLTDARMNIARIESEKALLDKTSRSELTGSIQGIRQQINAQQEKSASSESILRAMGGTINVAFSPDTGQETGSPHYTYRIVRSTARGAVEMPATDLTMLLPGDLVKVVLGNGGGGVLTEPKPTNGMPGQEPSKSVVPISDQR